MTKDESNIDKRRDAPAGEASIWFRAPTARERRIAGWLFIGFGVFFGMLFILYSGWWFRWVLLALGVFSFVRSIGYFRTHRHQEDQSN